MRLRRHATPQSPAFHGQTTNKYSTEQSSILALGSEEINIIYLYTLFWPPVSPNNNYLFS